MPTGCPRPWRAASLRVHRNPSRLSRSESGNPETSSKYRHEQGTGPRSFSCIARSGRDIAEPTLSPDTSVSASQGESAPGVRGAPPSSPVRAPTAPPRSLLDPRPQFQRRGRSARTPGPGHAVSHRGPEPFPSALGEALTGRRTAPASTRWQLKHAGGCPGPPH